MQDARHAIESTEGGLESPVLRLRREREELPAQTLRAIQGNTGRHYAQSARGVLRIVARMAGVSESDVLSASRKESLCAVRFAVAYALRKERGMTFYQIRDVLGYGCHTSAVRGVRVAEDAIEVRNQPLRSWALTALRIAGERRKHTPLYDTDHIKASGRAWWEAHNKRVGGLR